MSEEKEHRDSQGQEFLSNSPDSATDEYVGKVLNGKYKIVKLLGSGGMSSVYQAEHVGLERAVAVKILKTEKIDGTAEQRFEREAKVLASLKHENILSAQAIETTQTGTRFIVMELLEGRTLADRIRSDGPLPPQEVVAISRQILKGLMYAHNAGILHRDLKPSNIIVSTDGQVRLLDFGIAKLLDGSDCQEQELTGTNALLGSPDYMSPEQCRNEELDARSDIYSMGCLMYECVVGYPPFRGENAFVVMSAHLNETPAKNDSIDRYPSLKAIILECLEKERENRYQSAEELDRRLAWWMGTGERSGGDQKKKSKKHFPVRSGTATVLTAAIVVSLTIAMTTKLFQGKNFRADTVVIGDRTLPLNHEIGEQARWLRTLLPDMADQRTYLRAWIAYNVDRSAGSDRPKVSSASYSHALYAYYILLGNYEGGSDEISAEEYSRIKQEAKALVESDYPEPSGVEPRYYYHYLKGSIYRLIGSPERALKELSGLTSFTGRRQQHRRLEVSCALELVYEDLGQWQKAIDEATGVAKYTIDQQVVASQFKRVAIIYFKLGEDQKALDSAELCMRKYASAGNADSNGGHGLVDLASNLLKYNHPEEAEKAFLLSIPFLKHKNIDKSLWLKFLAKPELKRDPERACRLKVAYDKALRELTRQQS